MSEQNGGSAMKTQKCGAVSSHPTAAVCTLPIGHDEATHRRYVNHQTHRWAGATKPRPNPVETALEAATAWGKEMERQRDVAVEQLRRMIAEVLPPLDGTGKAFVVDELMDSDALTGDDEGTPTIYSVHVDDIPYLVDVVLAAAARVRQVGSSSEREFLA